MSRLKLVASAAINIGEKELVAASIPTVRLPLIIVRRVNVWFFSFALFKTGLLIIDN